MKIKNINNLVFTNNILLLATALFTALIIFQSSIHPVLGQNLGSEVTLYIKVTLTNNQPLPGAEVIVKPTIYSTHEYVNTTDNNGLTIITTEYDTVTKTVYVKVKYWIYGELYCSKISIADKYITIVLDYTILKANISIYDEYLKPINASYELFYNSGTQQLKLVEKEAPSNYILINGTINGHYLLQNKDILSNYMLILKSMEKYMTIIRIDQTILERQEVIMDIHSPVIKVNNISYTIRRIDQSYFYKLILSIEICDGVNTENTVLKISYYYPKEERLIIIYLAGIKTNDSIKAFIYNATTTGIINKANLTLVLNITAIDPYNRETTLLKTINLKPPKQKYNTSTTIYTTTARYNESENITSTSSTQTTAGMNTNTARYFSPPINEDNELDSLSYIYYLGPIISISILLYEFIRRREE